MNREMFEQKKVASRREGIVPDCYLPGSCMECQLNGADGEGGEIELMDSTSDCSENK